MRRAAIAEGFRLAGLAFVVSHGVQAQDTLRLGERRCTSCSISVDRVATLGEEDGPGIVVYGAVVSRDAQGRFLVSTRIAPGRMVVFSKEGRFLQTLGRSGGGPGEFRRVWLIAPFRDGVVVYDDFARRSTVFNLNLEVTGVRDLREVPTSASLTSDGSGTIAAIVPTADLVGYTLHDVDRSGKRVRSFGLSPLPYREDLQDVFRRDVTPGLDSNFVWASHRREYAFARCRRGTSACTLYARPVGWFPRPSLADPWDTDIVGNNPPPPPPNLLGVSQDASRYLWTISWVPDHQWREGVKVGPGEYQIKDLNAFYDTMIERIDLVTRRVVATHRVDVALSSFIAPGVTWYYDEDDRGTGHITVVRLRLEGIP